ncbi:hypothetical protein IU470_02600 [Nocardia abscessus]|uniref:Uncharacterized protein n=1 Tax=Nocardia abscessus TaxID=120957 RepID=A0ABS0C0W1_9NOCA|nr:hypothetical protein [Nocardia abscessus]MBF6224014.1 hypothetical protein [Nocardia abscessus]
MTSSPGRIRAEFSGISTRSWEHPADRTTLVTLRSLTGFDVVPRTYRANFDQPEDPLIRTVRTLGRDGGAAASTVTHEVGERRFGDRRTARADLQRVISQATTMSTSRATRAS